MRNFYLKAAFSLLLISLGYCTITQFKGIPDKEDPLKLTAIKKKKLTREEKSAFNQARLLYEFDMLKDPGTGRMPENIRKHEFALARILPEKLYSPASGVQGADNLNNYFAVGPNNIGGRTRAVAYDVRYNNSSNRVILSGSVSGGIFRSADGGLNWLRVSPENDIHNLSALAQDPRAGFENTWYAGGGEALGNSTSATGAAYHSRGILKSTDNGITWTRLTENFTDLNGTTYGAGQLEVFDHPFDYVHRIVVNPSNGHVYVAAHRRLLRSTDGGSSWQVVFSGISAASASTGQMDICVTSSGKLILAVNGGFRDHAYRGIWVSPNGNPNSWTRIAGGQTLGVDSVANWRGNSYKVTSVSPDTTFESKRIIMALAPSDENILYVMYENGLSQASPQLKPEADLFRLDMSGGTYTWENLSDNMPDFPGSMGGVDPLALQGGYNMLLAVKPDDPDVVFVGGTNLFRSTDGFRTKNNIAWIGGYGRNFSSGLSVYTNSHADFHTMAFMPNNNNINPNYLKAIVGNDGGLQTTDNIMGTVNADEPVTWTMVNNYQTLQYYHVGIISTPGEQRFIGGAQDNGTHIRLNNNNSHQRLISGDGGAAALGYFNTKYDLLILGTSQFGSQYRLLNDSEGWSDITPSGLTKYPGYDDAYGDFVTFSKLNPDNVSDFYYVNFNRLFRATNINIPGSPNWTELLGVRSAVNPSNPANGNNISIRALAFTRGNYHPGHVMYIGTSNGRVLRLNDPRNAAPSAQPVDITPPKLMNYLNQARGVNISDIAVNPNDDNEIMVVVSNYTVTLANNTTENDFNIWWTKNAKSANPQWHMVEGNLTLPSIRSCEIVVKKENGQSITEYYVGTSVGLYSTQNIANAVANNTPVTWVREGGNVLNFAVVTDMDYRPADNVLLVGTHGNGMYYANIGNPDFRPDQTTGIPEPDRDNKDFIKRVYPTVTTSVIRYEVGNMFTINRLEVKLYNLTGQLVYHSARQYQNGEIHIGHLSKGTYVLTITSSDYKYQHVQKVMIR